MSDEELARRYPSRVIDHDTKHRYRGWLERRLLVNRCRRCATWHEPPAPVCPRCWSTDVAPEEVAGTGTIHLAMFLHQGPPAEGVDYATPYPVVTVELDEQQGLRYTSTVVGAHRDDIAIGARVALTWIERAGAPIPAFELVDL